MTFRADIESHPLYFDRRGVRHVTQAGLPETDPLAVKPITISDENAFSITNQRGNLRVIPLIWTFGLWR